MNIVTENDLIGIVGQHVWASKFTILAYRDGTVTTLPHGFFRTWLDEEPKFGAFHIGKCSGIGIGSIAKYDSDVQKLVIGRYVSGGMRLRFILNGQHETQYISTAMLSISNPQLKDMPPPPQYGDTVIKNDVWIGDEAMFMGGSTIENGCIIGARALVPPNFTSEPYGIYVGEPARLVKFRFSEKIREALLELAWWDMPTAWVRENNDAFLKRLGDDEGRGLELLAGLKKSKAAWAGKAPAEAIAGKR